MNDDMELKRALDALPREIEPPADAWAGIRAKIAGRSAIPQRHTFSWPEHFEPKTIRIAAGIAAIGLGMTYLAMNTRLDARWMVTTSPNDVVGVEGIKRYVLTEGQVVETGIEHASLKVGDIGWIRANPRTRLRLLRARPTEQRVALDRGRIYVTISAPPKLFLVQAPTGIVTDMGCAYDMSVDSTGATWISVRAGWVAFENHGRTSLVPQGFEVVTPRGQAVGTPIRDGATRAVAAAVRAFDLDHRDTLAVTTVLKLTDGRDAVTLWHMLPWVNDAQRDAIYNRLAGIAPPPAGVTHKGVVRDLNPIMLRLWWEQLPGTLKIDTSLMTKLWTLWLKAASWL